MDRTSIEEKLFLRFLKEKNVYKRYRYNFLSRSTVTACFLFKQTAKRWIDYSFYWFGTFEGGHFWMSMSTSWILFLDAWYDPHTIDYNPNSILNKIRRFIKRIFA